MSGKCNNEGKVLKSNIVVWHHRPQGLVPWGWRVRALVCSRNCRIVMAFSFDHGFSFSFSLVVTIRSRQLPISQPIPCLCPLLLTRFIQSQTTTTDWTCWHIQTQALFKWQLNRSDYACAFHISCFEKESKVHIKDLAVDWRMLNDYLKWHLKIHSGLVITPFNFATTTRRLVVKMLVYCGQQENSTNRCIILRGIWHLLIWLHDLH